MTTGAQIKPKRWPLWRIVLAYVMLFALAVASIWYVDRAAQRDFPSPESADPKPSQS